MAYEIRKGAQWVDLDAVEALLHTTYWARSRSREVIQKTIERSACYGAYDTETGRQLAFARVITDGLTIYYLCDVVVAPESRGMGVGKALVRYIAEDEALRGLRGLLITKDAQGLYAKFGFKLCDRPVMYH